jgi:hypothetical protein
MKTSKNISRVKDREIYYHVLLMKVNIIDTGKLAQSSKINKTTILTSSKYT